MPNESPPRWVWIATLLGAGIVVTVIAVTAIRLAHGAADPPVAGPVVWQDDTLAWADGPSLPLDSGVGAWYAAPAGAMLPEGPFTLDVRARLAPDSDPSATWGIWLASGDGARVIYAISGEGTTTTRRCPASAIPAAEIDSCPALRPEWRWMPYNRLYGPGRTNMITLHQEPSGAIRLRLNHEQLGVAPVDRTGEWGVWVRGGRDSGAVLEWEKATIRGTD